MMLKDIQIALIGGKGNKLTVAFIDKKGDLKGVVSIVKDYFKIQSNIKNETLWILWD